MNTHLARASLRTLSKPITNSLITNTTTPFARSFSSTMAKQTPKVLSTKPIAGSDSKFVELKQITYQDEDGKEVSQNSSCYSTLVLAAPMRTLGSGVDVEGTNGGGRAHHLAGAVATLSRLLPSPTTYHPGSALHSES